VADGTVGLVLVDIAAWTGISIVVGFVGARVPDRVLADDTWLTRIRAAEAGGRRWERLGVRRWKTALPEAGSLFGGRSKRHLGGRDELAHLVVETRRAELVHWSVAACGPLYLLWNPLWLGAVMVAAGLAFNAPFIVVQRFNRARLLRAIERPARRPAWGGGR
jgi:glycosyl-4,4'-diaponeurosporenoate acyltransferase